MLLGDGTRDRYRTADFAAYVRPSRGDARADGRRPASARPTRCPAPTAPSAATGTPASSRREQDDHLSLVAGLRRDQVARLEEAGVTTLTALAELPEERRVPRVPRDTLDKLRRQAALQLSRAAHREAALRAAALPRPDYGFGAAPRAADGRPLLRHRGRPVHRRQGARVPVRRRLAGRDGEERYTVLWAHDRDEERRAFERLIDLLHRLARRASGQPHLPLRVLRGAGAQDARDVPRDPRGRGRRPAPHRRAGRPLPRGPPGRARSPSTSYSLKQVEEFYWLEREAKVKEAGGSIVAYERWLLEPRPGGAGGDRALQPRGRATRPAACATGCWGCATS